MYVGPVKGPFLREGAFNQGVHQKGMAKFWFQQGWKFLIRGAFMETQKQTSLTAKSFKNISYNLVKYEVL